MGYLQGGKNYDLIEGILEEIEMVDRRYQILRERARQRTH